MSDAHKFAMSLKIGFPIIFCPSLRSPTIELDEAKSLLTIERLCQTNVTVCMWCDAFRTRSGI